MALPKYDRSYPRMKRGKGGRKEGRKDKEESDQIADRQTSSPTHHQDLRIVPLRPANYRKLARVRLALNQLSITITSLLIQRLSPLFPKQGRRRWSACVQTAPLVKTCMSFLTQPHLLCKQSNIKNISLTHFMIKSTRTGNLGTKKRKETERKKEKRKQRCIIFVNEFPYHERGCFFFIYSITVQI